MRQERRIIPAVLCPLIGCIPVLAFAQTSSTITVDFAIDEGASNQVASGLLHGLSSTHPAQYLIDGIKINAIRGADYYGYLPSLYEAATYHRAKATGAELMIGLYYRRDRSYWPGDGGDWDTWRNICRDEYNEAEAQSYDVYSWITWNEPRLQWGNLDTYMQAHLVAYQTIKELNPSARIQAPEDHAYSYDFLTRFLSYCKDNDCLPDVLSWHELSENPLDIDGHCSEINSWMQSNGIDPMPIAITEYQGSSYSNDNTSVPGVNVFYLAEMERAVKYGFAFGLHACWSWTGDDPNFVATLADMANKDGADLPRGLWWNYNAYKDMTGRLVGVSVSGENGDALASTDSDMQRSIVLIGNSNYETPHDVALELRNVPAYLTYQGSVNIRAELIPDGIVVMSPLVKVAGDYPVSYDSVALNLPIMDPRSSYIVYISPATADAPKLSFEAEALDAAFATGRNYRTLDDSEASGGQAVVLESTNNGDYLEYRLSGLGSGVYNLTAAMKRGTNRGFIQLYVDGQSVAPPEDEYGADGYYENDFGNIAVGSGDLLLRFVVVNKNVNSSDRWMVFDRFDFSSPSADLDNDTPGEAGSGAEGSGGAGSGGAGSAGRAPTGGATGTGGATERGGTTGTITGGTGTVTYAADAGTVTTGGAGAVAIGENFAPIRASEGDESSGCGCSIGGRRSNSVWPILSGILAFSLRRRRLVVARRARAAVIVNTSRRRGRRYRQEIGDFTHPRPPSHRYIISL